MSFIRPEVSGIIWKYREPIIWVPVMLSSLWMLMNARGFLMIALCAVLYAVSTAFLLVSVQRVRFRQATASAGVVVIDERRVGYFGPVTGGSLEMDELGELELIMADNEPQWRLTDKTGQCITVPTAAKGADGLFDLFTALPGFSMDAALRALEARSEVDVSLWKTQ
ncbi:MAG: hypothetical protein AAGK98_13480 [Pseudomonadota bacterium]